MFLDNGFDSVSSEKCVTKTSLSDSWFLARLLRASTKRDVLCG